MLHIINLIISHLYIPYRKLSSSSKGEWPLSEPVIETHSMYKPATKGVSCPNCPQENSGPRYLCHSSPTLCGIIPVTCEALQMTDLYPISLPHYTPLSLPLGAPPPPVGHWPTSSPDCTPIPHLDRRFLYNLLSFHAQLIHHPDDGGSTHLWNITLLQCDYMALHARRL
jgi:hypothetical protein